MGRILENFASRYAFHHGPISDLNLPPYEEVNDLDPSKKFLAKKMNVKYPITPVHTRESMALFKRLESQYNGELEKILSPYNDEANGKTIFFKTLPLLGKHVKHFKRVISRKTTMANNIQAREYENPVISLPLLASPALVETSRVSDPVNRHGSDSTSNRQQMFPVSSIPIRAAQQIVIRPHPVIPSYVMDQGSSKRPRYSRPRTGSRFCKFFASELD